MKISVLQEDLNRGLSIVSRSVSAKAALPILANILVGTEEKRLKLSATNLETGINLWIGAKVDKEGSIAIPAKILTEFISSLPAEKVELEGKETTLFVSSPQFKANILGMDPSEFPKISSFSGDPVLVFEKVELIKALSQVTIAAAQDEGRPVLTGVLVKGEEKNLLLVATDGYRLSLKRIVTEENKIGRDNFVIPAKALLEVSRICQEDSSENKTIKMGLTPEKSQVIFCLPEVEFSSRLIEGEFPDFEKIIPKNCTTKAVFGREELLRAVKTASIFAREQANIIRLKINPSTNGGKLVISAETPQVGANESEIEANIEGESLEIAFNFRFLLDFLGVVSGEEVIFEASGPLTPGVFRLKGDESFFHIIMPVRIQS